MASGPARGAERVVLPGMSGARVPVPGGAAINDPRDAPGDPVGDWLLAQRLPRPVPPPLRAAGTITPGGLLGVNFPICDRHEVVSSTESLDASSAAYNPVRSEYLVVWHALGRATYTDIWGQRIAATGSSVGGPILISGAAGVQAAPSVAYEPGTGVFWVAWTDFRDGSGDVRLRRVSTLGELIGGELVANSDAPDAYAARLACGVNACAVVWASDPHDGNAHVLIRSYNPVTLASSEALLLSEAFGQIGEPDVCFNQDDLNFMVVWQQVNASRQWDVWSYHLNWQLYGLGRRVVSNAVYHQQKARVAYGHGAGRYLVVWEDSRSNVSWDVYGQLLDRAGLLVGGNQAIYAGPWRDIAPVVAGHTGALSEFLVAFQHDISGALQDQVYACRVSGGGAVSAAVPVREWYNVRTRPGIAHRAGTDDYLVTFTDDAYGTQPDIEAQGARGNGVLVSSLRVVSRGRKGQEAPAAAYNPARNEYLAAWADFRDNADYDLYFRRLGPTGAALAPEFTLASTSALYGEPHVLCNPGADECLAVWQEVTSQASGFEIYARRISGAGAALGGPIQVSRDTAATNEGRPRVVRHPGSGEYLVVWHAFTGGVWRIWAQRLAAGGTLVGANFPISDGAGLAQNPRVALDPGAGQYVVVWQDVRNNRIDVYGQRVASGGGLLGVNFAVSTATGDKDKCDVAFDGASGTWLVVWGDTRSGGADIWGQRLDGSAALVGDPFAIVESGILEVAPSVAADVLGNEFLLTWWALDPSTDYDIWARRVPASGLPTVPAFPVSGSLETQTRADLVQNTANAEFMVFWQDFRNGNYDIFGQRWTRLPRARLHRVVTGREPAP